LFWSGIREQVAISDKLRGTHAERLECMREIHDQIRARIGMWFNEMCAIEA